MNDNTLWMDKYKPLTLEGLTFHPNQTRLLQSLSENSEFPHLIFYGPDGAGKKTRVHCFLAKVYGDGIYKVNTINKELKLKSKNISYMVTSSNYHLEFCPSDVGNNDKFIISHVIKETSSFAQLDTETQKNFKVIVLSEADKMTKEAQSALTPITFISFFPAMIASMTGVSNSLIKSAIPFLNFTMIYEDVLDGKNCLLNILIMIISSLIIIYLLVKTNIKKYKSEKVLF